MERHKMKKVLCPVEGKNGKTYWMRIGNAFDNKDGSMNVYLDAYPANCKLQIRDFDDDYKPNSNHNGKGGGNDRATDSLPF